LTVHVVGFVVRVVVVALWFTAQSSSFASANGADSITATLVREAHLAFCFPLAFAVDDFGWPQVAYPRALS
jgi:hypothetical protein